MKIFMLRLLLWVGVLVAAWPVLYLLGVIFSRIWHHPILLVALVGWIVADIAYSELKRSHRPVIGETNAWLYLGGVLLALLLALATGFGFAALIWK